MGEDRDAGVATVFVALVVGVLLVVAGLGIRLGGVVIARERAETAADLGALAGAARALWGQGVACARAGSVVSGNGGLMVSCVVQGFDVLVEARVGTWGGSASGRARAGPVETG
ncbi:helicase/secretion neighborhood TadE-like protein [Nakamurella panacisegetis]|uniref:Helicase/secretion neighborhood TadE-like protein n=1 Tax=Nakamurella panacisegetis TaxID=1090615 RepID=A0A1H0NC69_9ACTN|nr:Rv3654c family TadE-like protein [Nakamurella panacisegetis]SDO90005.1 helicase/secretion neighborhood TadE-like protein [Nakamurella panacisegetis]